MKKITNIAILLSVAWLLLLISPGVQVMAGESEEYSLARGGRLYDKWFKVTGAGSPGKANPSYPAEGKYKGKKGADWRCKECHGWDYLGKNGAYGSGKHYTGIGGVEKASGYDKKAVLGILKNEVHGFDGAMLSESDASDLADFLTKGQVDMSVHIDNDTGKAAGRAKEGKKYYETLCASCHGLDGKQEENASLGKLANKNPWEVLHKILNGQPTEKMVALRAFDISVSVDILSYMQEGLPAE